MLPNREFFRIYGPYLHRPIIWPEICRREFLSPFMFRIGLARETIDDRAQAKAAATKWCESVAVPPATAMQNMGVSEPLPKSLEEIFPEEFAYAQKQVATCTVQLGGASNLSLLFALTQFLRATSVVETGVAYGWSSLAILLSLRKRPGARLYSVDLPYFRLRSDPAVGCAVASELHAQWQLYRMADREGLPRALREAKIIDLAHYDSDKSAKGRSWAYPLLWKALRPGGMLVSDDVGDNFAFKDFAEKLRADPIVVCDGGKFQGLLVKPHR